MTGLVIHLEAGGAVAGRVLLDSPSARELVRCTLVQAGAADVPLALEMLDSRRLTSGRLAAGAYTLRVELAGQAQPMLVMEGLEVMNGVLTEPPEINPLDLRGRLREIPIRVTDEEGGPLAASLRYRPAGGGDDAWKTHRYDPPGPLLLRSGADALDVEAAAPGMRSLLQQGLNAETVLRLRPGPAVVLVLREPPQLPAGCVLRANLRPLVSGWDKGSTLGRFGARVARLSACGPGAHEIVLTLEQQRDGHGRFATLSPAAGPIEVLDVGCEQTFFIDLDQASIAQAEFGPW
jgi:hypothetical protein